MAAPRPSHQVGRAYRRPRLGGRLVLSFLACGVLSACSSPGGLNSSPEPGSEPRVDTILAHAWEGYKHDFIQSDGRVIDPERNMTTSEGQSYAMLRAVWMGDRHEFDVLLRWTRDNLSVPETGLPGYLWGPDADGHYRLLSRDSAGDADEDMALALIFAADRWHDDSSYGREGRRLLGSIWSGEVAYVQDAPYLTAGSWAPSETDPGPVLNPSYLAPYAYQVFARVDSAHPWRKLVASSYRALDQCSRALLQGSHSAGLPPNWCALDRASGGARAFNRISHADDYGYDAFRVMWRLALDVQWNQAPDAQSYLRGSAGLFLRQQWAKSGSLASQYGHDGSVQGGDDLTVYGGDIGAALTVDRGLARAMEKKLLDSYQEQGGLGWFDRRHSYYEQNWVWFGIALAEGRTPDLSR